MNVSSVPRELHWNPVSLCWLLVAIIIAGLIGNTARGQESATAENTATAETAEGAEEAEDVRPTLDLGQFDVKDLRPVRNDTAKVTFSLHLAFANDVSKEQLAVLETWKHRLRDQVITSVRITEMKDFQEPNLEILRRNIRIRVNRLLKTKAVEDILLTEYLFRTH